MDALPSAHSRRGWDSNPRYPDRVQLLSREPDSTALAPLRFEKLLSVLSCRRVSRFAAIRNLLGYAGDRSSALRASGTTRLRYGPCCRRAPRFAVVRALLSVCSCRRVSRFAAIRNLLGLRPFRIVPHLRLRYDPSSVHTLLSARSSLRCGARLAVGVFLGLRPPVHTLPERVGFEPTVPAKVQRFSRPPP
jgi:hypothetical protein